MKQAVVVGQDNASNCLIAKFDGSSWAVDTSFPTINGKLWSCFSYSINDIWVAGGTGNLGVTAPILYHYSNGIWTDYSSVISDAVYFSRIDGNSSKNVWLTGQASGALGSGAWNWDGSNWTSTKQNTIEIGYFNGMSVSAEGHCYQVGGAAEPGTRRVFSNKTVAGFADVSGFNSRYVSAINDECIYATWDSGYIVNKYGWYVGDAGWVLGWHVVEESGFGEILAAYSEDHYTFHDGARIYKPGMTVISAVNPVFTEIGHSHGGACYLDEVDDIWYCGTKYSGTWTSVPTLTHYEGGTSWSGPTDYNVNGLNASVWYDIKGYLFEYVVPIPCNVDYIDPDYTLNHYICHPTQRKATDGQRVIVAPFSIANPSIKIRRK